MTEARKDKYFLWTGQPGQLHSLFNQFEQGIKLVKQKQGVHIVKWEGGKNKTKQNNKTKKACGTKQNT